MIRLEAVSMFFKFFRIVTEAKFRKQQIEKPNTVSVFFSQRRTKMPIWNVQIRVKSNLQNENDKLKPGMLKCILLFIRFDKNISGHSAFNC